MRDDASDRTATDHLGRADLAESPQFDAEKFNKASHRYQFTRNTFILKEFYGSTPAIRSKSRSRCRTGMLEKIACVAIRQSFADRGVTPAHRHRAYKCAALRAASRVSGEFTNGNSPSTRSQRVNRSGLSAPRRTSWRIVAVSHTGCLCWLAQEIAHSLAFPGCAQSHLRKLGENYRLE
jgi:hypothetical protein